MVRKSVEKTFNAMLDVRDYWYRAVTSTVEIERPIGHYRVIRPHE
jgi:hypothetical protein